ncbi:methyltransferase, ATP-grasp peptide maturase system [Amycolatopsis arida]|uniref:Protein-L-isoaspartate O-methyltransferase n=1 Tax=Amycolatopsis arida TaxID=587909 RepID=A0A1I5YBQ7_9PSEU|nr:ATP-grasp peptide maturase system methyltransferase [Amycolatopsis arida]TDX90408.1 methyltransferase of ATP-grasp peptide maturase system [Amycolatopsis arida]SFQ41613.1 methyltransferase, ATP-grasp peptide maturase system [Amycolatopsis arida]
MPLLSRDRRRLVELLRREGVLHDPRWAAAFASVPRHVFVPRFFVPRGPAWRAVGRGDEGWLRQVYDDTVLVTQLDDDPERWRYAREHGPVRGIPTSSSSMPGIMAVMLEELRVADGQRVLEIGAGTGYNAALLCARLGDRLVSTVDIDPALVAAARAALAACGFHPTCEVHDGELGYPPNAPYDRVLGTCSVSRIPPAWLAQTRPGGLVVTTLNRPIGAGLVRITVRADGTGIGSVLARDGRFMPLRAHRLLPSVPDPVGGSSRATDLPLGTVLDPGSRFEFFAGFTLAGVVPVPDPTGGDVVHLVHPDGSWVRHRPAGDGYTVEQGGPRRLWDAVEEAHAQWRALGSPGRADFGLTVTERAQEFWLGSPNSDLRWPLG